VAVEDSMLHGAASGAEAAIEYIDDGRFPAEGEPH
jgi:hypothetical protein